MCIATLCHRLTKLITSQESVQVLHQVNQREEGHVIKSRQGVSLAS